GKELEAHQRGNRIAGQAEHGRPVDHAERQRLRRLDRDLPRLHPPQASERRLHVVEVADRDAPARENSVAAGDGVLQRARDDALVVGREACNTRTASPSRSVYSTITTASAPSGIGAPVMIRMASPSPTGCSGARPAGSSPATARRTGASGPAPAVSAASTA